MKHKSFLLSSFSLIALCGSCSDKIEVAPEPEKPANDTIVKVSDYIVCKKELLKNSGGETVDISYYNSWRDNEKIRLVGLTGDSIGTMISTTLSSSSEKNDNGNGNGSESRSATFTGEFPGDSISLYAVYPSDLNVSVNPSFVNIVLPQTQLYSVEGNPRNSLPALGKVVIPPVDTDTTVTATAKAYRTDLKNILGIVELQLTGSETVTSIMITDKSGSTLWGNVSVSRAMLDSIGMQTTPIINIDETKFTTLSNNNNSANQLVLDCSGGVALKANEPTSFYLMVPSGSFANGMEVEVTTYHGKATSSVTCDEIVKRSVFEPVQNIQTSALSFEIPEFDIENETVKLLLNKDYSNYVKTYVTTKVFTDKLYYALSSENPQPYRNDQPNEKVIRFTSKTASAAKVTLSEDKDFTSLLSEKTVTLIDGEGKDTLTNFVPGRTYYYKVMAGSEQLTAGCFKATGLVRQIKAQHSWNHRDLGGWLGWNGNRVRYEQIYRGGPVCGANSAATNNTWRIPQEDIDELKRVGYAAHLDLRGKCINRQPWGMWTNDGNQINSNSPGTTVLDIESEDFLNLCSDSILFKFNRGTALVGDVAFVIKEVLAGHPTYFHCRSGADRTGMVAYAILGLLGCDGYTVTRGNPGYKANCSQVLLDYELTNLSLDELGTMSYTDYLDGKSDKYDNEYISRPTTAMHEGFKGLRTVTYPDGKNNMLTTLQARIYYYLNRYFLDHPMTDLDGQKRSSVTIKKSDLNRFINYMLGITDREGNVIENKQMFVGNYEWAQDDQMSLDEAIQTAWDEQYLLNYAHKGN